MFRCNGKSAMLINIQNDGNKTYQIVRMPRRLIVSNFIISKSRLSFSFLKSNAETVIRAVIGGSTGYIENGLPSMVWFLQNWR